MVCKRCDAELTREQEHNHRMVMLHSYRALSQLQTSKAIADMEMGMIRERIIDALSWTAESTEVCLLPPVIASSDLNQAGDLQQQEGNDNDHNEQQLHTRHPA